MRNRLAQGVPGVQINENEATDHVDANVLQFHAVAREILNGFTFWSAAEIAFYIVSP
jgi:hypothetical protein